MREAIHSARPARALPLRKTAIAPCHNEHVKSPATQALLAATASVGLLFGPPAYPQVARRPIVIEKVTVIDVSTGQRRSGMTVLISQGKIARVSPAGGTPQGAVRVKGEGKFLIPGLWDMHTSSLPTVS